MLFIKKPKDFAPIFVVSCFCEHGGDILLLKRQKDKPQGGTWGVPAGKIDLGEKPVEAIIREMQEESGIIVDKADISFFKKVYIKYTDLDFVYYIFHTKFDEKPEVKIRSGEHSEYVWVSPEKSLEMNLIEDLDGCIRLYYKVK